MSKHIRKSDRRGLEARRRRREREEREQDEFETFYALRFGTSATRYVDLGEAFAGYTVMSSLRGTR